MRVIAAVLTLMLVTSSFVLKQKWYTYENQKAKISIKFPAQFETSTKETEKATTYKAQLQSGGMLFMASSSIHNQSLENQKEELLQTSLDSFNESLNGSIKTAEPIELKGADGLFATITIGDANSLLEYRVFLKGTMQYQIITAQIEGDYDQQTADEFYKSFKILK